ncbi:redoxin family protein [Gemmatimonas sp.]|uniref:redoxin family protein n=1 Tax=Gemmatimonas sp. TaxID=1962908 RepID=UPI00286E1C7F|nr:redoxin family protein [Gemmatimonas sp.]
MRWTLTAVLIAVLGSAYALESHRPASTLAGRIAVSMSSRAGVSDSGRPAPAWKNASWLNAPAPVSLASLKGRVVLLNFWVFTCYNCTNTLPSLRTLDAQYRDRGLSIIGIHTPEFPPYAGEHDKNNVAKALTKYAITYPIAQDNDRASWDLYRIQYWPSFVLIDKQGRVRYEGYGEFHVGDRWHTEWERRIKTLLAE